MIPVYNNKQNRFSFTRLFWTSNNHQYPYSENDLPEKLSKLCLQRVYLDRLCLSESSEVVQRPRDGVLIHTFPLCGVCVVSLTHNIGIPLKDVLTSSNVLQNWNTLQCNIMGLYSDTEALKD